MSIYKTIEQENKKLEIYYDEDTESPDSWGNEDIFIVYDHRQFYVKREGFDPKDIFEYYSLKHQLTQFQEEETKEELEDDLKGYFDYDSEYYIWVLNAYIHSGVALSLGKEYPFNDRWDVSTSGYVLCSKKEFPTKEKAMNAAESLVETWNEYLSGQIFGFQLFEKKEFTKKYKGSNLEIQDFEWEKTDSCWGYYGEEGIKQILSEHNIKEEELV